MRELGVVRLVFPITGNLLIQLISSSHIPMVNFFRFNPQLSEDIAMDEKNDQKLINMLWCAKAYVHANRNKIIEMINSLK